MLVAPEPSSAKLPPINEIAHDVEVGGFGVAEKTEQFADLGVFRAGWTSDIRSRDSS